ncbi:MAG TPA: hypothetical protein PKA00_03580 [Saprospiraceae bacterium]|nr:hypothetical protein [Saprospiraceae bacterium]HMQ81958.1 hypothetical protein [Saprospiraceae bacterium]
MKSCFWQLLLALGLLMTGGSLQAQYFGRNKPNYENFDFEVYQSPHFEIYHYLSNKERLNEFAQQSEWWYQQHQAILADTILGKNPIILYNDHADFQQTNTISGSIGVGTGGVTEAFKNRVVMPFALSNEQTHHVLGHEMVHAFQYNMILNGDSMSIQNLANLPLWLVEGLAEYLSIGSVDAHTAMWMRDAVLRDDVPDMDDLSKPQYFPYRYGQAFWAFLTGLKGDEIIEPFFVAVAKLGFDQACVAVLGMSKDNLSSLWVNGLKNHYTPFLGDKKERFTGKALITEKNGGSLNIAPSISPNGRYVIFLSEKDLFSIDLFLADARTGEVIRKVASSTRSSHIDDFNYIESSGTWSPNSEQFAFVAFSKGRNILIIKEVQTGKTVSELELKGVPAFSNPAWSPDGKTIVVSGMANGQTDLYTVNVRNGDIQQLTDDRYAELHPYWSDDGSYLVYSTDQLSMENGRTNGKWTFNLAILDVVSGLAEQINVFPGADNLNPVLDTAQNILFLSNRDGFRNLYRYERNTGAIFQLTDLLTGVSGITPYAPAISVERRRDKVLYTYFSNNTYQIYQAKSDDFLNRPVDASAVNFEAAQLPRVNRMASNLVDQQLAGVDAAMALPDTAFSVVKYQPKFKLDYIGGSAGIGIGSNQAFGTTTGLAGGIDLLFSDILGNNQIFSTLALNGEITDFGGIVGYMNRKSRINWGGALSHVPVRFQQLYYGGIDTIPGTAFLADRYLLDNFRRFEDRVDVFAQYPFSTTLRVEAGSSFSRYSFRYDRLDNYYDAFGQLVYQERERLDEPPGFNLASVQAAVVGDNSFFALASPLEGSRFRLGAERYFGAFDFTAATADYRIYRYFDPVGVAFRLMHYGRYGQDHENLYDLYAGSPWFIRGYSNAESQNILIDNGIPVSDLLGSKLLISNVELRIPFTGPKRLALIGSKFLFTELALFADGGVAWYDYDQWNGAVYQLDSEGNPILDGNGNPLEVYAGVRPVFSTGVSMRVNLFGALIIEPYYAIPLLKETRGVFGLNFIPGW